MAKKLVVISLIITLLTFTLSVNYNVANATSVTYAQVNNHSTFLYKTSKNDESLNNKWCLLPKTFFVKILNNYNDIYYKAQFYDIIGYVKKSEVQIIKETPLKPYPTQKTLTTNTSCYLRRTPETKSPLINVIKTLPTNTSNIQFIGKIIGEDYETKGTTWYLVKHNNDLGYIHLSFTSILIIDETNAEPVTIVYQNVTPNLMPLSNTQNLLIILLILSPLLLIMFLLYKPQKVKQISHKHKNQKHKIDMSESIKYYNDNDV